MKFMLRGTWANPKIELVGSATEENNEKMETYDILKPLVFSKLGDAKKEANRWLRSHRMSAEERAYRVFCINGVTIDDLVDEVFDDLEYAREEAMEANAK